MSIPDPNHEAVIKILNKAVLEENFSVLDAYRKKFLTINGEVIYNEIPKEVLIATIKSTVLTLPKKLEMVKYLCSPKPIESLNEDDQSHSAQMKDYVERREHFRKNVLKFRALHSNMTKEEFEETYGESIMERMPEAPPKIPPRKNVMLKEVDLSKFDPLIYAEDKEIIEYLIKDKSVEPQVKNYHKYPLEVIKYIINNNKDDKIIKPKNKFKPEHVMNLVNFDMQLLKLLSTNRLINNKLNNEQNRNLLHLVSANFYDDVKNSSMIEYLTSKVDLFDIKVARRTEEIFDVNSKDSRNYTPLHIACENGCLSNVKDLIDAGAVISATTKDGNTPLHLVDRNRLHDDIECDKSLEIINYLISKVDKPKDLDLINTRNIEDSMAIHFLCEKKDDMKDQVLTLIKNGAKINEENKRGHTPLLIAIKNKNFKIAAHLFKKIIEDEWVKS